MRDDLGALEQLVPPHVGPVLVGVDDAPRHARPDPAEQLDHPARVGQVRLGVDHHPAAQVDEPRVRVARPACSLRAAKQLSLTCCSFMSAGRAGTSHVGSWSVLRVTTSPERPAVTAGDTIRPRPCGRRPAGRGCEATQSPADRAQPSIGIPQKRSQTCRSEAPAATAVGHGRRDQRSRDRRSGPRARRPGRRAADVGPFPGPAGRRAPRGRRGRLPLDQPPHPDAHEGAAGAGWPTPSSTRGPRGR